MLPRRRGGGGYYPPPRAELRQPISTDGQRGPDTLYQRVPLLRRQLALLLKVRRRTVADSTGETSTGLPSS